MFSTCLNLYLRHQAADVPHYLLEQTILSFIGWIPTILDIAIRAMTYRFITELNGWAAIEKNVWLWFPSSIRLANGQGGIRMGNKVYSAQLVQILAADWG